MANSPKRNPLSLGRKIELGFGLLALVSLIYLFAIHWSLGVLGTIGWGIAYGILLLILLGLSKIGVFVVAVPEGRIVVVVKNGKFSHALMSFSGYHLNDPKSVHYQVACSSPDDPNTLIPCDDWDVVPDVVGVNYDNRCLTFRIINVHFVGIPPVYEVYRYPFTWNEIRLNKLTGEEEVFTRDEMTPYFFVSDVNYPIVLKEVEDVDGVPINGIAMLTVSVRNPKKAAFSGEDWLTRLTSAVTSVARNYFGRRAYKQLLSENEHEHDDRFSGPVICLNTRLPDERILSEGMPSKEPRGMMGRYGVYTRNAELQGIDPHPELRAATLEKYTAERKAEATRVTADATAYKITTEGKAEADVIRQTADARAYEQVTTGFAETKTFLMKIEAMRRNPEAAKFVLYMDALVAATQGPGTHTIWANAATISKDIFSAVPGAADFLKEAGLSVEDIANFVKANSKKESA